MIAVCPHCSARFRIPPAKQKSTRMSLRCGRCRQVFAVEPEPAAASDIRVLVAHSDPALCETIGELLQRGRIGYELCHDGPTALQRMEASPPQVALVDVALPGLYAFEVVEKVRGRQGLEEVKIILLSSVYNRTAYKRRPTSLYGADAYIEKHHLPDDLVPKIEWLTQPPSAEPPPQPDADQTTEDWETVNETIRQAEERETSGGVADQAVEKARRLARIIVSDIALYNQERVEEGIAKDNFFQLLADEIAEGERLFAAKVAPEIREHEPFMQRAFTELIARRRQELFASN